MQGNPTESISNDIGILLVLGNTKDEAAMVAQQVIGQSSSSQGEGL